MADPDNGAKSEASREQDGGGLNHPTPASESSRGNATPEVEGEGSVEHAVRDVAGSHGRIEVVEDSGAAAGDEIVEGADMKALHNRAS